MYNIEVRNSMRSNKMKELPSYEEALRRRNSSSTQSSTRTDDSRNGSFKVLPDKYFAVSKDDRRKNSTEEASPFESQVPERYTLPSNEEMNRQLMNRQRSLSWDSKKEPLLNPDGEFSDNEMFRTSSLASQLSLDSILYGPNNPFARDGFGRLSISEKKGADSNNGFRCECYKGYTGSLCEVAHVDCLNGTCSVCTATTCQNGGTCIEGGGNTRCQ